MKRPILIIIGAILVLILLFVWVYVLFFSDPPQEGEEVFAEFPFGIGGQTFPEEGVEGEPEEVVVDVTGEERLYQLTSLPVVGYQEIFTETGSSSNVVLFIEAGTGHIYSIDLQSGEESRVSGTTFSKSNKGAVTPDGQYAMLQSDLGLNAEFFVGTISSSSESIITTQINESIIDFVSTPENTFLYAVQSPSSVTAKQYYPTSDTTETLFTVPFREAVIVWGSTADSKHYVYPRASNQLEGFLYQSNNTSIERLPVSGYGLTGIGSEDTILYNQLVDGEYRSFLFKDDDNILLNLSSTFFTEKCSRLFSDSSKLFCASEGKQQNDKLPDDWYRGSVTFSDNLWLTDLQNSASTFLINVENETGRQLDIVNISSNLNDSRLYFTNKNDQTLWTYIVNETE